MNQLLAAVALASKKFGSRTVHQIVGSTGYWDQMGPEEGSYANVDSHGRVGVVVVLDIYENGEKVNRETRSLFQRHSDNPTMAASGQGDSEGPAYHYARGLESRAEGWLQNWVTLLEKGEVEHSFQDVGGETISHRYVLVAS